MDDAMVWGPKFWWGALPYLDGVMELGSQSLVGLVWLSHLDDVMDLGHQPLMTCVIPSWRCKGFGVLVFDATGCPIFGNSVFHGVGCPLESVQPAFGLSEVNCSFILGKILQNLVTNSILKCLFHSTGPLKGSLWDKG